ncbi:hypothetical protein [Methylicorpusculum sp.]|uniref:hypothetical protein n=1 Tax=Methylicorpusculum sp. TaxID=2713644 RepID=UPI002ABB7CAC|nr:hypothetical protein [Methylicorpusculum sp.]MDZ4151252.1 hypothetical protein [Methylicorpusculum sp.]
MKKLLALLALVAVAGTAQADLQEQLKNLAGQEGSVTLTSKVTAGPETTSTFSLIIPKTKKEEFIKRLKSISTIKSLKQTAEIAVGGTTTVQYEVVVITTQ